MAKYYPEAKFPVIMFGDGLLAQLAKIKSLGQDEDGIDTTELTIWPTTEMKAHYGMDEYEDLDELGLATKRFPTKMIIKLGAEGSLDPMSGAIVVLCSWNWEDTALTRHFPVLEIMEDFQKQIITLKKINARLQKEISMLMSNKTQYFKEIGDMVKQVQGYSAINGMNPMNLDAPYPPQEDQQPK